MPFIRYARDKRGYESTFVMHAYRAANGSSRARVLYFFRSPSGLRVGRRPLESEVTEALEHTHPDLAFDWLTLLREPGLPRLEVRDRPSRSSGQRFGGRPEPQRPRPPAETPPTVVEDESLLGRTVGAQEAARLRARYSELLQRIVRRARTPDDRDRLTERVHRLNPDDWPDQAAIRAGVPSIDVEWDAIAGELPNRRRGRRGGRIRGEGRPDRALSANTASPEVPGGSVIIGIGGEGDPHDDAQEEFELGHRGQGAPVDDAGDSGRRGTEPDAEPESTAEPADSAVSGETAATADRPDLPGRD